MTDAEKIADYNRVIQIITDAVTLEAHRRKSGAVWDQIVQLRANAFQDIVGATLGLEALNSGS